MSAHVIYCLYTFFFMEVAGVMLQVMYTGIMPIKKITEQRVRAHLLIFFFTSEIIFRVWVRI